MDLNNRVLIIDDDKSVLENYQDILGFDDFEDDPLEAFMEEVPSDPITYRMHFEFEMATQGEEGVFLAKEAMEKNKPFAVAFLDMRMPPGIDGLETARRLRDLDPGIYIVVVTAYADRENYMDSLQSIVSRNFLMIRKPFTEEEIFQLARNYCQAWSRDYELMELQTELEQKVAVRSEELRETYEQLQETQAEMIRRLGHAVEFRDNETGFHVERISHYADRLAKEVGFSVARCQLLKDVSTIHDIGKIGIPDRILLKEGKLDEEEWVIMKQHAEIGAQLLEGNDSRLFKMARNITRYHHEKWNGSGYPEGLKGEKIPMEARILAVVDVFDALTSKRPYKKSWPVEQAFDELIKLSGSHFDPRLVDLFLRIREDILKIKDRYSDEKAPPSVSVNV
jgi:putative two-component system response regulator